MKYLAHIDKSLDSNIVSIYDVAMDIKDNPKECEEKRYYSLWYLTPMFPKIGEQKKSHFAFF